MRKSSVWEEGDGYPWGVIGGEEEEACRGREEEDGTGKAGEKRKRRRTI